MKIISALNNFNLKTKLLAIYILTIVIPILIIGQILLSTSSKKIIEQTTKTSYEACIQTSQNISNNLSQYVSLCNSISFDDTLIRYIDPTTIYDGALENMDAYNSYLRPKFNLNYTNFSQASLILYFYNKTLIPDSKNFIFVDNDVEKLEPFKKAINSNNNIVWGINKNNSTYLARTIKTVDMKLSCGVIYIEIPEQVFYSLMSKTETKNKIIVLSDNNGRVVSSNKRELVGQSVYNKKYFTEAAKEDKGSFDYTEDGYYKIIYDTIRVNGEQPGWKLINIIPLDNLVEDANRLRTTGIIICLLNVLLSTFVSIIFISRITSRIKIVINKMKRVRDGNFSRIEESSSKDEVGQMVASYNIMVDNLKRLINENFIVNLQMKDVIIKKREAELNALQSQINPHFLFNTLESIRMKLNSKEKEINQIEIASTMLISLARIMRKSLDWHGEIISLYEEIEMVENYLQIQKLRFRNKLEYELIIPDEFKNYKIPKLIIQPIVENAVKHGVEAKKGKGMVIVTAYKVNQKLIIEISDDGVGIDEDMINKIKADLENHSEPKSGESIGLKNVHERLVLHYGKPYGLYIESTINVKTSIQLIIPYNDSKAGDQNV